MDYVQIHKRVAPKLERARKMPAFQPVRFQVGGVRCSILRDAGGVFHYTAGRSPYLAIGGLIGHVYRFQA